MKTLSLTQQTEYHFATGLLESTHPDMTARIKKAIFGLAGMLLHDDLEISMPRFEAIELETANLASHNDEEETLAQQCKGYLGLLNRFNNYVGQGIEELIGTQLNSALKSSWTTDPNLEFVRNAVQFPDLYLVDRQHKRFLLSIEIKSWFVFAIDDITARFEAAPNLIRDDSLLVLFPWCMTKLISGTPKLLEPYIGNARALAQRRDNIWLAGGVREFNQGNVSAARRIELPPTAEAALNKTKTKSVAYQLKGTVFEKESDNFGKIWRIYDSQINTIFYPKTLQNQVLGKSIAQWRNQLGIDKK